MIPHGRNRPPSAGQLTAAAASGMRWSLSSTLGIAVVQVVYISVMSRLLDPRAFGIYAIAMLVLNTGDSFARMGVAQALIQRPTITRDDIRASVTTGTLLGFLLFAVLWVTAPTIGEFFSEPAAVPVIRVMGVHFVFIGFSVTGNSLLRRDLRFPQFSGAQFAAYVIGYAVVGISLAAAGAGVWSLVAAVLSAHFLVALFQYLYTRHPLRPVLDVRPFGHLYSFGARISVIRFLEFLGRQLDTITVGRYASTSALGQYNRAFVLVNVSMSQHLSHATTNVLFPGFSKIQGDEARTRRAFLSVIMLSGTLLWSVGAGIAAGAREIVLVLLGDQWDVAMSVVPFFAIAVALSVMTRLATLVCEARAELNKILGIQAVFIVALLVAYVAVSGIGGVVPFAAALAIGELGRHLVYVIVMRRMLGIRAVDMALAYGPGLVTAASVALAVMVASQLSRVDRVPTIAVLALEFAAAAVVLVLVVRFSPFRTFRREVRRRLDAAGMGRASIGVRRLPARLLVRPGPPRAAVDTPRR